MKREINRKDFLRISAAALAGGMLASCSNEVEQLREETEVQVVKEVELLEKEAEVQVSEEQTIVQTPGKQTEVQMPEEEAEGKLLEEPAEVQLLEQAAGIPHLAVARGSGEDEAQLAADLVRRALLALGGMERFVKAGDRVLIKPNICVAYHSYEYAATTNPYVVGTLVRLAFEAGAKAVQVMDNPFGGTAQKAYVISGIEEQVLAAGGEMAEMLSFKYIETDIPEGKDIQKWTIYEDALNCDVLIDAPIAKTHGLARLTLGMKNLMGVVLDRNGLHRNLGQRLADLTSRLHPALTVVDAMRMLMANGPSGGSLDDVQRANTIIASADIIAADSYAATQFGLKPEHLAYITAGTAMGLGRSDLENLEIEEITV